MRHRSGQDPSVRARDDLAAALRGRGHELVQEVLARVLAVAEPAATEDPQYIIDLENAVSVGVDYALTAIADGEQRTGPVPQLLLSRARQAAHNKVSLDVVLRRYLAGYMVLSDIILREVEARPGLADGGAQLLVGSLAALLDRTIPLVAAEHSRALESTFRAPSKGRRRAEVVERLLRGEMPETAELNYDLDLWHIGLVGSGHDAEAVIRALAVGLDRRCLLVRRDEGPFWGWLGGRDRLDPADVLPQLRNQGGDEMRMAIGEAGRRTVGWRTTIEQARAALPMARHQDGVVRYADVAVAATALQDGLLLTTLQQRYLDPLEGDRERARNLKETARRYLVAGRSVSSTAAALQVTRQTVRNRLRTIEDRLGCSLETCASDLDLALHLDALGYVGCSASAGALDASQD